MIFKKLKTPLYSGYTYICFYDYEFEVIEKFNFPPDLDYDAAGVFHINYRGHIANILAFRKSVLNHSTIAHECYHAANNILHSSRVETTVDNDEPGAYLIGWIAAEVYKLAHKNDVEILFKEF